MVQINANNIYFLYIWFNFQFNDFQTHTKDTYLDSVLWNYPQLNAKTSDWLVNIGLGNGLVPSLYMISVSPGLNELVPD